MRVTQKLIPGHPDQYYIESEKGWFSKASRMRSSILHDVLPVLGSDRSDDVMRFTMGQGPSGIEREAYYAGWLMVGYWLDHGMTFAEIARISERQMPGRVHDAINALLGH